MAHSDVERPRREAGPLVVRLLGGFGIGVGDREVPTGKLTGRRAGHLIAFLALAPSCRAGRDAIVETLWPGRPPAAAREALYKALHAAREALRLALGSDAEAWLRGRGGEISLGEPARVEVDAVAFEATAGAALRGDAVDACRAAAARYTGALWPNAGDEPWLDRRRAALARLHTRLLRRLAADAATRGDLDSALALVEQVAAEDPYDEAVLRERLRLLARLGRRPEALTRFDRFARRLRRELGVEPEPATLRLRDDLATGLNDAPGHAAGDAAATGPGGARLPAPASGADPAAPPGRSGTAWYLPRPLTAILGRDAEIHTLAELLTGGAARLVTVTGTGGVGKTRLALAAAAEVAAAFGDGAAFVDLAPVRDHRLVAATIARQLGASEDAGREPAEAIWAALRHRHLLLVVDNCEQVLDAATDLVATLERCPRVTVLATSRERLGVRGEREVPIWPLPVPAEAEREPNRLGQNPAAALFLERARAGQPAFVLTPAAAGAIAEICRQVDGLPLAIELAAARLRSRTPQALAAALERRLPVLTGGPRDLPARQRTLAATLRWSYDLLDPAQQALFRHLAVFAGGATLAAITAVGGEASPLADPADGLASLVDKHLLRRLERDGAEPRFTLLETVREFASERLEAAGEAGAAQRRHLDFLLDLAQHADAAIVGPDQPGWFERLGAEEANIWAVLAWADAGGEAARGLQLALRLTRYWWMRGRAAEGARWLDRLATAKADAPADLRTRTLIALAEMWYDVGYLDRTATYGQAALALARASGDRRLLVDALNAVGGVSQDQARWADARLENEERLAICRELGDRVNTARSLANLGQTMRALGDLDLATSYFETALANFQALGNTYSTAWTTANLGVVATLRGDFDRAEELYGEALAGFRRIGAQRLIVWGTVLLARVPELRGNLDRAIVLTESSLQLAHTIGYVNVRARIWQARGRMAARQGQPVLSVALLHRAVDYFRVSGRAGELSGALTDLAAVHRTYGETEAALDLLTEAVNLSRRTGVVVDLAWALLELGQLANQLPATPAAAEPLAEALALFQATQSAPGIAECLTASARMPEAAPERAAEWLGTAAALRAAMRVPQPSDWDRLVARVRTALGARRFDAAWAAGQSRPRDAAPDPAPRLPIRA